MENKATLDTMDHHDMGSYTCLPNCSSLALIEMCHELPVLEVIVGGW